MTADELVQILPYMRSTLSRALDRQKLRGERFVPHGERGPGVPCWLHRAKVGGPCPVFFEIHGGGFALGDARKEDALCAWIRDAFDVHVVGVGYRLAPECPFPAAVEDVLSCVEHVLGMDGLDVDAGRLYAMGYSAGATLACSYALGAPARGLPQLAGMALHYPCLDISWTPDPVRVRACDLPVDMMAAFSELYAGDSHARENPLASPVLAPRELLGTLPPVHLWPVEGDALLNQAAAFCSRLRDADVPCTWHEVPGCYHGYIEDAANPQADAAVSMPGTIDCRPRGWREAAWSNVRQSVERLVGTSGRELSFPAN